MHQLLEVATQRFAAEKDIKDILANLRYVCILTDYQSAVSRQSYPLLRRALSDLSVLKEEKSTPAYLIPYIQFQYIEWKLDYFLAEKNQDSTRYYLQLFQNTHHKNTLIYNRFIIDRYQAQALFLEKRYRESAEKYQLAVKRLDSASVAVVRNIDKLMYAQAEAEERQLLLNESETAKKQANNRMILLSSILGLILVGGSGLVFYLRHRQKARFMEFKLNMARNIHDETSPALLFAKALAKRARTSTDESDLEAHIGYTMELIRSLSHDLKSEKQYTLSDLITSCQQSLRRLSRVSGFQYTIKAPNNKNQFLSYHQFSHLKAVMNECITNSIKHARFDHITVQFLQRHNKLTIRYQDNGSGWDIKKASDGIGIQNMHERLHRLNGTLVVSNNYPIGFYIEYVIGLR